MLGEAADAVYYLESGEGPATFWVLINSIVYLKYVLGI